MFLTFNHTLTTPSTTPYHTTITTPAPTPPPRPLANPQQKLDTIDTKLNAINAKLNMLTAPVAAIGTIEGIVVVVAVVAAGVAAGVSLEKSAVTVSARAQVPVSRESAPLQVEAPSTSTTIAVASPFPARD